MKGIVVKSTGSWYTVKGDAGEEVPCKIKGNFRLRDIKSTNPVAVGDRVEYRQNSDGVAYITEIEERRNYIVRKSANLSKQSHILAANLDQCLLMVTVNHPRTSPIFIDRFLASAEAYRVPARLLFNKCDLYDDNERDTLNQWVALYQQIGYPCHTLSAANGHGVQQVSSLLQGRVSLLAGNSGVGKSTLLNAIAPHVRQRTGDISHIHNKGMHTTTFSQMFEVAPNSYLIDTPGIKGFGTFDMTEEEISHYFVEIFAASKECRYSNCTHTHEPHCAVQQAVEEGRIALSRYQSYLNMLDDEEEGKYRSPF